MAVYRYDAGNDIALRAIELANNAIHYRGSATRGISKLHVRTRAEMTPDTNCVEPVWFNTLDSAWCAWTSRKFGNYIRFDAPAPIAIIAMLAAEAEALDINDCIAQGAASAPAKARL
ncbi:hypothetical protein LXA47_31230 [Massilia sp. P8910]|uniref:hypothetical protein n=1 Tax=Massilia antarctica TaxID=2765360 RepID=UPI001E56B117|nr:hypothetical protein [Massilia antarctica]MCE3608044.1 hypothetical protein [Massilia antarctica]